MEVKDKILNYLKTKKKAVSLNDITDDLGLDSFLVQHSLNELINELKVSTKKNKYIFANYVAGKLLITKTGSGYIVHNNIKIWIKNKYLKGAVEGDDVIVNVIHNSSKDSDGEVVCVKNHKAVNKKDTIIGQLDDPKMEIYSTLARFNVNVEFSNDVKKEIEKLDGEVKESDLKGRLDLRNEMIFTIDGDDAKDLDDAVSLRLLGNGNYLLGVHIADVSNYVKENSATDKEARNRGTSVYTPGCVIPMLPHELSNGICSLFSDVDRLTISAIMEFTPTGKLVNSKIVPSVIRSSKRMTYHKVEDVINGNPDEDYKKFADNLLLMNKFKSILRKNRMKNGSIDFDIDKVKVVVDEKGKPLDIYKEERGEAEKLIEEFMLVANTTVASYLENKELPSIYRIHGLPNEDKLNEFVNLLSNVGIRIHIDEDSININKIIESIKKLPNSEIYCEMLLRTMDKASYSTSNIGHYGLNFPTYTHFTSPIRRYPDLTVHRLIKTYSYPYRDKDHEQQFVYEQDVKLRDIATHSSMKEQNADYCERTIDRMKMAEFLEDKIGQKFDGTVSEFTKYGVAVELYNGIRGLVSEGGTISNYTFKTPYGLYNIGDPIPVQVVSTDKHKGEIRFKEKVLTR